MALAPAAQAGFGPETFEAGTCVNNTCTYPGIEANHNEAFTQAAGHPPWGITKFVMKHSGSSIEGASVKRIRVDVPPGLASNPQAPMPKCSIAQFNAAPSGCPASSEAGTTELEAVAEPLGIPLSLPSLTGKVYNLEAPPGLPLDFGIAVEPAGELITPIHLFLEGHVDWSGDFHEYFEINNVPNEAEVKALIGVKAPLKVLMSKLNFNGHAGGDFLTLPSICSSTTTSHLELESWSGEIARTETHTPLGVEGCNKVPFSPSATITPETGQSDAPDGATTIVRVPQGVHENEINTSDIQNVRLTLPEGLTLNPAAAHGLQACSGAQIGIGTTRAVGCPAGSKIGTVAIETDLPPGSLTGNVYLGSAGGGPITDPPYTIYLDAESPSYGVSVRLQGSVTPNPGTGRLEVTFAENPQLPFSELRLTLNGGVHAPLANPLACGAATTAFAFTPYTGGATAIGSTPFLTNGCPSPLPFSLAQGTADSPANAGAFGSTAFTLNLARAGGQQYLSALTTVLPSGLVGAIPSVKLCGDPQANTGTCAAASQIGSATADVGSGDPYPFTGPVFLTGPYGSSPYGLSIPIHALAGPFDLGTIVTRAAINVDPHTGRVIATTTLPTIFKGVPLRLHSISVVVNRPGFLFNPTNCGPLATNTTLTSTFNATQGVSSPFQAIDCNALKFKPAFGVSSSAQASKAGGAGLKVNLTQVAREANIHSVLVQLPAQLPSRLTTLQKACPAATYASNPLGCPAGSRVGSATVTTPVLPDALTGPAYLVAQGSAFPNLDLLLAGDGVHVILEGTTNIKGGITTSTFPSIPDVPVSSFVLDLPMGPNSALASAGNLCSHALIMPTTITAQSGAQVKQNTIIDVPDCPFGSFAHKIRILHHKIVGHTLILTVQSLEAGRITAAGGKDLKTVHRGVRKPATVTLRVPLSRRGKKALRSRVREHHRLTLNVHVTLNPQRKGESNSSAVSKVAFRR